MKFMILLSLLAVATHQQILMPRPSMMPYPYLQRSHFDEHLQDYSNGIDSPYDPLGPVFILTDVIPFDLNISAVIQSNILFTISHDSPLRMMKLYRRKTSTCWTNIKDTPKLSLESRVIDNTKNYSIPTISKTIDLFSGVLPLTSRLPKQPRSLSHLLAQLLL